MMKGWNTWPVGWFVLLLATVIVGVSILADGNLAKALNGIGGLCWFLSTALIVRDALRYERRLPIWVSILALTAMVAFVVRPNNLGTASIGFLIAGAAAAWLVSSAPLRGAILIPALYLPMHIGVAVIRAAFRDGESIRSEPPPTAFIVPLVMVIAAIVGGLAVVSLMQRRQLRTNA